MLEHLEEYIIPETVAEAVRLLRRRPVGSAVAITGDIDHHWWRLQRARRIVDTSRLGLDQIKTAQGGLRLGAATLLEDIVQSKPCQRFAGGLLVAGARGLASPLKRHSTSLASMIINAVPTVDITAALLLLDACVKVQGQRRRTVAMDDLFVGKGRTALDRELLLEVALPKPPPRFGTALERHALTPSDTPMLTVIAGLALTRGRIADVRLAVGGGVKVPLRLPAVERNLVGKAPSAPMFAEAAAALAKAIKPISDSRASVDHRRAVAEPLARRALARALESIR